ncbi:MAG: hypothetical protein HZC25_01755 [Rhodospirillales bacterium]|nr:hypothetical protein [Rhodospirillales bacterium]
MKPGALSLAMPMTGRVIAQPAALPPGAAPQALTGGRDRAADLVIDLSPAAWHTLADARDHPARIDRAPLANQAYRYITHATLAV